jgi:hypothetical protein
MLPSETYKTESSGTELGSVIYTVDEAQMDRLAEFLLGNRYVEVEASQWPLLSIVRAELEKRLSRQVAVKRVGRRLAIILMKGPLPNPLLPDPRNRQPWFQDPREQVQFEPSPADPGRAVAEPPSERWVRHPWLKSVEEYVAPLESTCSGDVLTNAISKPPGLQTRADQMIVGGCLRFLGWSKRKVWHPSDSGSGGRSVQRWYPPKQTVEEPPCAAQD